MLLMKKPHKTLSVSLYVIVIAAFFAIIADTLLTTGMFMDGLIYADVANNMARGIGSFWHPSCTLTFHHEFYEHPPLAMWLLSLFFRIFGDGVWVVRLYSMLVTALTALLMLKLWKHLGFDMEMGWLPLMMWTLVPAVTLNSHENMLECTMAVFVLGAVLAIYKDGYWRMALAGVLLLCAFLTKGFTGLYPFLLPFILFITRPRNNAFTRSFAHAFHRMLSNTVVMLAAFGAGFALICVLSNDAWTYLTTYFSHQVSGTINDAVVDSRFWILKKFFEETVILWVLVLFGIVREIRRCKADPCMAPNLPQLPLVLLTLSGVIPIMVSMKQRDFYILTVYPFLAVSVSVGLCDMVERWCRRGSKTVAAVSVALAAATVVVAVVLNASYYDKPGRDVAMQNDLDIIKEYLEEGELISVGTDEYVNYSMHGYYYREKRVSLEHGYRQRHLVMRDEDLFRQLQLDTIYAPMTLPTQEYHLYERVNGD